MKGHKCSKTERGRGAFGKRLVASLLVMIAVCIAVPAVAYADDFIEPDLLTDVGDMPVTLTAQSDGDDLIAQYPDFANAILANYVKRSSEPITVPSDLEFSDVQAIRKSILKKHPELCDVGTDFSTANNQFVPDYLFEDKSYDEILSMRQDMARAIAHAMSWIPKDGTDLEKVKAAHDWLVSHVLYHKATEQASDIEKQSWKRESGCYGNILANHEPFYPYCAYGPLVEYSGVCEGISYAFMLLMDQCGIPCEYVQNPMASHGWNHVYVDGQWYNLDATWDLDDSSYEGDYYTKIYSGYTQYWPYWVPGNINYFYFLKSDTAVARVDAERNKTRPYHANYDPYGTYNYCAATDTTYDDKDESYWDYHSPVPNVTYQGDENYEGHTKTQVESFALSQSTVTLAVGETAQVAVQDVAPATINPLASRLTSSDPSIAYVCADGTVVAVSDGTATITCTMGDADIACMADRTAEVTRTCEVTVGSEAPAQEPEFTTAQLVLGEQIKMEYWLTVPAGVDVSDGSAVFSIEDKNARTSDPISVAEAEQDTANGRYGFMFELSSIEMAEPITCTFTYGDGKAVEKTFSVKGYIDAALAYGLTSTEEACIRAIANYGHYMQPYLSKSAGWTIGTDYQAMDHYFEDENDVSAATTAVQGFQPHKSGEGQSDVNITCSLSLDSYTTFNLYFTPVDGAEFSATATFNGKSYEATKVGKRYRIQVDRIKAGQLGDTVAITGKVGGKDFMVTMQPLSFAYVVLNDSSYATMAKEAVTSLYNYYNTAIALKS